MFDPLTPPPLLTSTLPGIGGIIKQVPEDFEVEELPAYEPSGTGPHLYLWIEKRGLGAEYFVRQLAERLDIPVREIGTAGLKDRHAVTRQMVSVPETVADRLDRIEGEGVRLLRVSRHGNKLRPGHLHGNRFRILVRQPEPDAIVRLNPLLGQLRKLGVPNYYGPQRFGRDGETVKLGLALLHGETAGRTSNPSDAMRRPRLSPFLRKLALSAAQSALFNHYLAWRLQDGLLHQVIAGDVMAKRPFGGLFVATDVPSEQARFDARETVHTGPIFGRKIFSAAADAAAREKATFADADLAAESFTGFGKLLLGTRRLNLIYVDDLQAVAESDGIRLAFSLPAGSYATVLLREIMKTANVDSRE